MHKTSFPRYPQSNGKIEATVKSMKKIITTSWESRSLKADTVCCALQYRNIPSCKDGQSPAQKMYGRPIQDTLPVHHHSFGSGNTVPLKLNNWQHTTWHSLSHSIAHMCNISQICNWAQLSPSRIPGQTFGTYMAW